MEKQGNIEAILRQYWSNIEAIFRQYWGNIEAILRQYWGVQRGCRPARLAAWICSWEPALELGSMQGMCLGAEQSGKCLPPFSLHALTHPLHQSNDHHWLSGSMEIVDHHDQWHGQWHWPLVILFQKNHMLQRKLIINIKPHVRVDISFPNMQRT